MSEDSAYNISKAASGELLYSLLGGSALNYLGHRACVHKASLAERRAKMHIDLGDLAKRKELAEGQDRNRFHIATRNGACLSAVPHRFISTELSQEEFRDKICLRYGLMHQDIPVPCDGCGEKFSIEHALSFPNGGFVMSRHDDAAKEWGALRAWALIPSSITYKPKINIRTVQGETTGDEARQ